MSAQDTGNADFIQAAEEVKGLATKPSNETLLELYGLFKQSIQGDNAGDRPGMFDPKGRYVWACLL